MTRLDLTAAYGLGRPPVVGGLGSFDVVTFCNAGEPAPLLAQRETGCRDCQRPGQVCCSASIQSTHATARKFRSHRAALAFYTDCLVDRRKHPTSTPTQIERLALVGRAFVASDNAETACSRIIAGGLGDDSVEDDVALLVVRRPA